MGEIGERRLNVQLVAHPVFGVRREGAKLIAVGAADAAARARASSTSISSRSPTKRHAPTSSARSPACSAKCGWRCRIGAPCSSASAAWSAELKTNPPPLPVDEIAEAIQFLQWLLADNFTFLGMRNYIFDGNGAGAGFRQTRSASCASRELRVLKQGNELLEYTPEIMAFLKEPRLLIIAKANIHSRVHRRVYLDYIGIKRFDASGNLVGELRIVGLFTSTAYTRSAHSIPYLRRKIAGVEAARRIRSRSSHSGKALANVLEHYPRDELFQIDEETLYHFAIAILQLDERPRVRVLARRDRFDRFVSVLVFVPRERYDSDIRARIGDYLSRVFIGHVSAFYPFFPEGPLVRVHFIIGRSGGPAPAVDSATLEREVAAIVRTWNDGLARRLGAGQFAGNRRAICSRAIATRFRQASRKTTRRRSRRPISASSNRYPNSVRSASISITGSRKSSAQRRLEGVELRRGRCRCRSACRCWRTWASGWSTSAPIRSRRAVTRPGSGCTTCCWSGATAA